MAEGCPVILPGLGVGIGVGLGVGLAVVAAYLIVRSREAPSEEDVGSQLDTALYYGYSSSERERMLSGWRY